MPRPALVLLCTAQALVVLDQAIVGLVLPGLPTGFGVTPAALPWVLNAYVIAFGGLSLLGGRLADLYGARRMFAVGFAAVAASALAAGLAPSPAALIGARAAQGASAALVTPAALALLRTRFGAQPAALRGAMAAWGVSAAIGGVAGLALGGVLLEWTSWRWAFLIDAPIAGLALLATPRWLPATPRRPGQLDLAGALAGTGGTALAVAAIVGARTAAPIVTLGLAAASAGLLAGFARLQRGARAPLVPPSLVRAPELALGNLLTALVGAAYVPLWFLLTVYVHGGLGHHGLAGALALLPMRLALLVLSLALTGRALARFGPGATLAVGLLALGAGVGLLARAPSPGGFVVDALAPSLLAALGMALAYVPAMLIATRGVAPAERGLASGLVSTSYQLGSALGLAVTAALPVALAPLAAAGFALAGAALAARAGTGKDRPARSCSAHLPVARSPS